MRLAALAAVLLAQPTATPPRLAEPVTVGSVRLAAPTTAQAAWHDLELGMFIHIAPQTWQDRETDDLSTPLTAINPEKLDTEQWVRTAKAMGARYIVFVAKHEGGFCWWQTQTTEHGVRNTPWRAGKGDVLADLSKSCKAANMRLGVYLSPQDRIHGVGVGGRAKDPARQAEYEKLFREQLVEVLSRYGEMTEVWFDGSLIFDVGDILARHAPNAVVFQGPQATIRWVGNEDGVAPYPAWNTVDSRKMKWGDYTGADGDPRGDRWLPNECDARIRATWFWHTDNASTLKSVDALMAMYEKSVGRGAVLLLNNTPDRSGLIPEKDAKRSAEFGEEIQRRFGTAYAESSGRGGEITVQPSAPVQVGYVVTMEDITQGERVRKYVIEGEADGKWEQIAEGTSIGHKKIDMITPRKFAAVRLRVLESAAEPIIRRLAVYPPANVPVTPVFDHP